ncbi:glycoside hydrolase family 9 protein [Maricaulis maris]|jgi:endoglucanase|uniref:glycoside hydrolase family 9 protein n=1 Tax=Maricaulis maris TaxID=74318 RepID=UPI0026EA374B|nr:glycoside hydrolase family 9 protein [Maricaulis maris]
MLVTLISLTQALAAAGCDIPAGETPILFNQTGFESGAVKLAVLRNAATEPARWEIRDASGSVRLNGETIVHGLDASSGDFVHQIRFDALTDQGEDYQLTVCGEESRPFTIADEPYGRLAEDALRYFYLNRLGTELQPEFTGGAMWARAAGFIDSHPTCFFGPDQEGTEWPGCSYTLEATGGWADAGDYGQYVVNGGISVWTLQHAYERLAARGQLATLGWTGERVALPQEQETISEILLEARWHLDWMLTMQIPDGETVWVDQRLPGADTADLQEIDGSGLVHHKLHERAWLPLPLLPQDAAEERFLIPPSTAASLNLAAAAAQASRLWAELDPDYAVRTLEAARRAYTAAQRNPDLLARNNFDGGGAYGDTDLLDEFAWAAAELFLTTGDTGYADDLAAVLTNDAYQPSPIFWANTGLLADLSLALSDEPSPERADAADRLIAEANRYLEEADREGYHFPMPASEMNWGSNANLLNRGLVLASAHDLTGDERYRNGAVHALDYVLGRNALDQSYVSGHGVRSMQTPHHRFWARGADPEFPPAPAGALSGGANHLNMADPVAMEMRGTCAPQRCWADHVDAFALNEVAINWNAPLFALAAQLESTTAQASE